MWVVCKDERKDNTSSKGKRMIVCQETITRTLKNGDTEKGFYLNEKLKENLDYELKRLEKGWDCVYLYDGEEGSGKTTMACANAYYMASQKKVKFGIDNIIFTVNQFDELVESAVPFTNIVWDEFVMSGLSTETLTKIQIALVKKMTMIRKKRLVIHLVIPYIFMLNKYFAIARTRCLINVFSPDNLKRGYFKYYSKPSKKFLYMSGHKFWDYTKTNPELVGSFTDTFGLFFNKELYDTKKEDAMQSIGESPEADKFSIRVNIIVNKLQEKYKLNISQISEMFGYTCPKPLTEHIKRAKSLEKVGLDVGVGAKLRYNPSNSKNEVVEVE